MYKKMFSARSSTTCRRFGVPRPAWLLLAAVLGLAGCGGGGSGGSSGDSGEVVVSLTDAPGDFATYTVDVLSLKLTRADGRVVETLPLTTRVDFTGYTDVSEFLTAATVPNGRYVKGSMVLDYSNADIEVENASGDAVPVTAIVDGNGKPVGTLQVDVTLAGQSALPVAPGTPKNLLLDFDLQQSNSVAFAGSDVTLSVAPVLIAQVDPQAPGVQRLRGPLQSVNVAENRFRLYIRPFFHPVRTGARRFGSLDVYTGDNTFYEIDGISYQGAPGLQVLDSLPAFSAVIARGDLRFNPLRFEASEVYAGGSVPGGDLDVVRGSVVERTPGDTLIVKGATLMRRDGSVVFNDRVTVQLDPSTSVTRQLATGSFDINDISVGQRIVVFGSVINDAASDLQFSAANGYARMRLSTLRGTVQALPGATDRLALDLTAINNRSIDLYRFTGTGADTASDADPAFYEIDTGALPLDATGLTDAVAVVGFPTPFGSAPPDFTAQTVVTQGHL
jgi:Domain of unknown function (DUF4382)